MNDNNIRQIVGDNDFFAGLEQGALDYLAEHVTRRQLGDGKVLFHQGDKAKHFYLLISGHLSLGIPALEGPSLELQDIGPGQVTGWSWLMPPNLWNFQARARTPIDFLEFDGEAVLQHCDEEPAFGYPLVKRFSSLMSERLQFARLKMMDEWKPLGFA